MTALYMLAEVVGGFLTGSLALLADSGHLLGDVLGLAMAVAAIRFARRPATAGKTYGFYRAEILAALLNSIGLLAVAGGSCSPPGSASTRRLLRSTRCPCCSWPAVASPSR